MLQLSGRPGQNGQGAEGKEKQSAWENQKRQMPQSGVKREAGLHHEGPGGHGEEFCTQQQQRSVEEVCVGWCSIGFHCFGTITDVGDQKESG